MWDTALTRPWLMKYSAKYTVVSGIMYFRRGCTGNKTGQVTVSTPSGQLLFGDSIVDLFTEMYTIFYTQLVVYAAII